MYITCHILLKSLLICFLICFLSAHLYFDSSDLAGQPPEPPRPCTWSGPVVDKSISGNNVMELEGTTLAKCQAQCVDLAFCKSIDWKPQESKCSLNAEDDSDGTLGNFPNFEWYRKECFPGKGH